MTVNKATLDLVGRGLVDSETATAIGGAAATVIVAVWSVIAKRRA